MELVFNELSIPQIISDKETGIESFECFLKAYSYAVSKYSFSRSILTAHDLNDIIISNGYYSSIWRNDCHTDRDLKTLYKRMCDLQQILEPSDDLEITFEGTAGKGMLIAYIDELFMLSIPSEMKFNQFKIQGDCYSLETDQTTRVTLSNISSVKNIDDNQSEISDYINKHRVEYNSLKELLENISTAFPNLVFGKEARNQIKTQLQIQHLSAVINKLKQLDDYFSHWDGERFDMTCFPNKSVSPESKETLNRYKDEHTFVFDGEPVVVSYHIRYTGNIPGRIYFYPDQKSKKGLICSLTTKLSTILYPKSKI